MTRRYYALVALVLIVFGTLLYLTHRVQALHDEWTQPEETR